MTVVDASVAAKWLFRESLRERAARLLDVDAELLAPDTIWGELGEVVRQKLGAGRVGREEAAVILGEVLRIPVAALHTRPYLQLAFEIALDTGESVYDGLYLAVAEAYDCQVVTADRALVDAVAGTRWEDRVIALGDLPEE